ncbi:HpcH/HpaI aldolase/citrate lyase family protein [Psychrobacter jeotgali]|uniref:HpcH/HpaI aldolase/citrate lyase family protein n=1 Tax=Psychrobacter jeotgali TaxID=179010 RepID=UPI00191A067C|nr:CoA ester lyase [Psychrobacter jeotgali]
MPISHAHHITANNAEFSNHKTWLFVPGTRVERISKAFASGADAVIVDLEDAVAQADKAPARAALLEYYSNEQQQPVWLRVNQATSKEFAKDLALCQQMQALAGKSLAGIVLAKAERADDIEQIHQATALPVIALIESAAGLHKIDTISKASGLLAFSYGFLDLCNDLGVQVGTAAADIVANQVRYQLIVASAVQQLLAPIDTIHPDFDDHEGLMQRTQLWSQMGMSGMLCIHPKQVTSVQQALQPTQQQLEFAKQVVAEYERSGEAVFKVDGMMIDAPVIERCRQILSSR